MDNVRFADELNGYLKMLGRLGIIHCDFSASLVEKSSGIDGEVKAYLAQFPEVLDLKELKKIDRQGFEAALNEYIYSNITLERKDLQKIISWDIGEYFGLIAMSEDGESFNPVGDCYYQASIGSATHKMLTLLVIDCLGDLVFLILGVRK